jgi:hypothetical protein
MLVRNAVRLFLWSGLWAMVLSLPVRAQVPLPPELREAKAIYFEQGAGEPRALDELARHFRAWNRLAIAESREQADLVATITTAGTGDAMAVPIGGIVVAAQEQAWFFILRSTRTDQPVWSDKEAIGSFSRYGGIRKFVERLRKGGEAG